jgi:starvation-inducible DNA-binding protein
MASIGARQAWDAACHEGKAMCLSDQDPALHPTRIALPLEVRRYVVGLLNHTLACTIDLRSQAKQAAWNIRGTDVPQLQPFFATIATELDAYTDLLAERIVVLGGVVRGTVRTAAVQSTLPEYPCAIVEGHAHVRALAERVAHYATTMRSGITHTADVEDAVTSAVYTDITRGIEKRLGDLESYLYRPEPR